MSARLNFLCIASAAEAVARCRDIATDFQYSFQTMNSADDLLDDTKNTFEQVQFILVHLANLQKKEEIVGVVQTIRQIHADSYICVIADKKIPPEVAEFAKKSGANMVLLENEFHETSRLEYISSQIIRASYIPVKLSEFKKDTVLDFTLFYLMPLNQKLLPVVPKGSPITESRLKKLETVGEVYVKRDEVDNYRLYVESHPDNSAQGLKSRCRAQYLSFCKAHAQLLFLLIDQSEGASFKEGKWLYERSEILARDLLTSLSAIGEAWEVVNNSSIGEFGSVERSPTVAAYAGLLSLLASISEPVDVMVAALLSDVGMLELHPKISKKMRAAQGVDSLQGEDLADYRKHPVISLSRCMGRKLAIKPEIQEMMMGCHERADGTGFPNAKKGEKIPQGAMLIQFSEMIDRGAMVKMGQEKISVQDVRNKIIQTEMTDAKIFNLGFLQKIKPIL